VRTLHLVGNTVHLPDMKGKIETREFSYTAGFEPAEEGGFVVTFPALPGLITEGDTLEQARAMAAEALHGYLESLAKDGLLPPAEDPQPSMPLIRETVTAAI
jgi:antitoxin HicB